MQSSFISTQCWLKSMSLKLVTQNSIKILAQHSVRVYIRTSHPTLPFDSFPERLWVFISDHARFSSGFPYTIPSICTTLTCCRVPKTFPHQMCFYTDAPRKERCRKSFHNNTFSSFSMLNTPLLHPGIIALFLSSLWPTGPCKGNQAHEDLEGWAVAPSTAFSDQEIIPLIFIIKGKWSLSSQLLRTNPEHKLSTAAKN